MLGNEGFGLFDIKLDYNNLSKKTLERYGSLPIIKLELRRHPIPSMISKALKWITGHHKVAYDTYYHLGIIVTVSGGKKIIIEKLEVVNISSDFETFDYDEHLEIPLNKSFTILDMVEKTRKRVGNEVFFSYSAFYNNCQDFVKINLESENLYTPNAQKFVHQDLTELLKHTPKLAQKVADTATYLASLYNKLSGGKKENRQKILAHDLLEFIKRHDITNFDEGYPRWYETLDERVKKILA